MSEQQQNHAQDDDEIVIDVLYLAKVLWKRLWIIILAAVVCGALALGGTKLFITPTYRASFSAYINNRNSTEASAILSSSDMAAMQSLAKTYTRVITSRYVLTTAAEKVEIVLPDEEQYETLKDMVSASVESDTGVVTVSVVMEDPETAKALADAIIEVATTYASTVVEGSSMQIIDKPVLSEKRYRPSYRRSIKIGILIGALLAAAIIIFRELMNDRVNDQDELEKRFNIPVIGAIPNITAARKSKYNYGYKSGEKR